MLPPVVVIGVGSMGGAVAARLLAVGFSVAVADPDVDAVGQLVDRGAVRWDGACADATIVLASLPNDEAVAAALDDDLLGRVPGTVLVELSTVLPATVQALADRARAFEIAVVDAPVSGRPADALAGELVLMVGAAQPALARARPVLDALGTVQRIGDVGSGKAMKIVNNTMSMGNIAIAAEAFTLGRQLGLDDRVMYDVISRSGGRSNQFDKRMPAALEGDYAARFALRLGEKDLRLALASGHDVSHPMPITATIHQIYEAARMRGLGEEDVIAILKVYAGG